MCMTLKNQFLKKTKRKKMFDDYKSLYEEENGFVVHNQFAVSDAVVKKEKKKIKTDIKLDTNIQIKVDIDAPDAAQEYLEKGYDEERKMKYYKVFFNEED